MNEFRFVIKLLRNEQLFRLIIITHENEEMPQRVQSVLKERFPGRKCHVINGKDKKTSYVDVLREYILLGSGFFFIENFDVLLNNDSNIECAEESMRRREIVCNLNWYRDNLTKSPICIFIFIKNEDSLLKMARQMGDLFAFRNFIL